MRRDEPQWSRGTSGPEETPLTPRSSEFSQIIKENLRDNVQDFQRLNEILITW